MFNWLLLLIFYLPFQIALNPRNGVDLSSLRVFIIVFFLAIIISWLIKKKGFNKENILNVLSVLLLLFVGLAFLSGLGAANIWWSFRKILYFVSIIPLFWISLNILNSFEKIKKAKAVLIISASVFAFFGLVQFLSQFVFPLEKVYDFWALNIIPVFSGFNMGGLILSFPSLLVNVNGATIMRAFSFFSDPHIFSFYLGLVLPLIIIGLAINKNKGLIFLSYLMVFSSILLSFARGAYLAVFAAFIVLMFLMWFYLKAKKTAVLLFVSLLVFIVPLTPISDRFYSSFDASEGSNMGRLEMWQQAGTLAFKNAWWGVGLGNYSLSINSDFGYRNPITAHNFYLDIFSEIGLFGLFIWLVLIFLILQRLFKIFNKEQDIEKKALSIGLFASLIYFLVHSFFETGIYHPSLFALLILILSLSYLCWRLGLQHDG